MPTISLHFLPTSKGQSIVTSSDKSPYYDTLLGWGLRTCFSPQSCMVQHRATAPCLAAFDAKCAAQNLLANTAFMRVGLGVTAPGGRVAVS